jgi:hypothetical protein
LIKDTENNSPFSWLFMTLDISENKILNCLLAIKSKRILSWVLNCWYIENPYIYLYYIFNRLDIFSWIISPLHSHLQRKFFNYVSLKKKKKKYKVSLFSVHEVWQLYYIESLVGHPVTTESSHRTAIRETHCNWDMSRFIVLSERNLLTNLIIFGAAFLKFALYFKYWDMIGNNKD